MQQQGTWLPGSLIVLPVMHGRCLSSFTGYIHVEPLALQQATDFCKIRTKNYVEIIMILISWLCAVREGKMGKTELFPEINAYRYVLRGNFTMSIIVVVYCRFQKGKQMHFPSAGVGESQSCGPNGNHHIYYFLQY